jgi:protein involved in polysaccharide export with SLBB domain
VLALACALASGCATTEPRLEHALLADRDPSAHGGDAADRYVVHCPDQVTLEVEARPEWAGAREVGPDGRIPAPDGGRLHVDGLTTSEIARTAADRLGLPARQVRAQVVGYNSQQIYLFGEAAGGERAVSYEGPETVLDLLQRVGGVAPGAAAGDVQVVRSHVADGSSPELFQVDLQAILVRHDQKTNVRLEPFDQVYIGQSRRSSVTSCLPPWLRPLFERICGLRGKPDAR